MALWILSLSSVWWRNRNSLRPCRHSQRILAPDLTSKITFTGPFEDILNKSASDTSSVVRPLVKCVCKGVASESRNRQFKRPFGFIWAKCSGSLEASSGLSPFRWFPWQLGGRTRRTLRRAPPSPAGVKSLPPVLKIKATVAESVRGVSSNQFSRLSFWIKPPELYCLSVL